MGWRGDMAITHRSGLRARHCAWRGRLARQKYHARLRRSGRERPGTWSLGQSPFGRENEGRGNGEQAIICNELCLGGE